MYEGEESQEQAVEMGMSPIVPPKKSRLHPWKSDKELYKKRNEGGAVLPALEELSAWVFSRLDKPDGRFTGFLVSPLTFNTPPLA